MPFIPLLSTEVDANSPIDDTLMGKIKSDLDYLNSLISNNSYSIVFKATGKLYYLRNTKTVIDGPIAGNIFTPSHARATLKRSGTTGSLIADIRTIKQTKTPITGIVHNLSLATQSIATAGSGLATQSVSRATAQIATQSISFAKSAANVQAITKMGGGPFWRYSLDVAPDSDTKIGDYYNISGCTTGANNGTFQIIDVNQGGSPSIVISNASGVAQAGAAGTARLNMMSFNFTNPVNAQFVAGEYFVAASHTTSTNNGALFVYKINQAGNNIWCKQFATAGTVQAGVAGTVDTARMQYNFSSAVLLTDFAVNERCKPSGHTSGNNDGEFQIMAINQGGNNIILLNPSGVVQAGVAGTVTPMRWVYSLPSDPSSKIVVGDYVSLEGHTSPPNNGVFQVKVINRGAINNIVIFNINGGVVQAGTGGNVYSTKKTVSFSSDQSANYAVNSYVELSGTSSYLYNTKESLAPFKIAAVNLGGGSNYNIVIDPGASFPEIPASGMVDCVQTSICNNPITVPADFLGRAGNAFQYFDFTDFIATPIPAGTMLGLFITTMMGGGPEDLVIQLQ